MFDTLYDKPWARIGPYLIGKSFQKIYFSIKAAIFFYIYESMSYYGPKCDFFMKHSNFAM